MGKNHQRSKKLKSERSKTHITSKTKFLPKGQNVTKTEFKIRPIVIQEQLQARELDKSGAPRKYQNITELLPKLRHFNDTIKTEACEELIAIIKKFSIDHLQTNLAPIIQLTANLIQDRERKVRRISVKLIEVIIKDTPVDKLRPFFTYISTNLCCAMTNIDKNIQEDSLLLLDAILDNCPTMVLSSSSGDKIFPNFLTLISKLKNEAAMSRQQQMTLTLNLNRNVTSVKWRIKVLSRLYRFLVALLGPKTSDSTTEGTVTTYKTSEHYFIPLYKNCDLGQSADKYFSGGTIKGDESIQNLNFLVPLLYETWLEVMPEKSKAPCGNEATNMDAESAAILSCIMNIFHLLSGGHESMDREKFLESILASFPYERTVGKKSDKKKSGDIAKEIKQLPIEHDDLKCVQENLLIIYSVLDLPKSVIFNNKSIRSKMASVALYIKRCLLGNVPTQNSPNALKCLLLILRQVMNADKSWDKILGSDNILELMDHSIVFYEKTHNTDLLEILTTKSARSEKHQGWLGELPALLCRNSTLSHGLIKKILTLCMESHTLVQDGMIKYCRQILDIVPTLKIVDTVDEEMSKMNIIHIFFYLPLGGADLSHLTDYCNKNQNVYSKCLRNVLLAKGIY